MDCHGASLRGCSRGLLHFCTADSGHLLVAQVLELLTSKLGTTGNTVLMAAASSGDMGSFEAALKATRDALDGDKTRVR